MTHHQNIALHVDYFFVNKLPILHTKSAGISYLMVQTGKDRTIKNIKEHLLQTIEMYHRRGFKVTTIHGDNEFDRKIKGCS